MRSLGQPADTSPEAAERQLAIWRTMPVRDKARLIASLSYAVDQMALAGIKQRHPEASRREQLLRLAILKLGLDLAQRVYPDVAALIKP